MLSAVVWVVMMTGAVMCGNGSGCGRVDVAMMHGCYGCCGNVGWRVSHSDCVVVVWCAYDACDVDCGMDGVYMCSVVVLDGLGCSDCGM